MLPIQLKRQNQLKPTRVKYTLKLNSNSNLLLYYGLKETKSHKILVYDRKKKKDKRRESM